MENSKLIIGIGMVILAIGLFLMSSITIYSGDATRTWTEIAIKLAIFGLGALILKKGQDMRDAR